MMKNSDDSGRFAPLVQIIRNTDAPMFLLSPDARGDIRYTSVNDAYRALAGPQAAEIAGQRPQDILAPHRANRVLASYSACLTTGTPDRYEETLDLPGQRVWHRTTLAPYREGGRIVAAMGTTTDITALRQELETAVTGADSLRRQTASLRALVNTSVAQLRGPLNNIVSMGRLLHQEFRPPTEQKEQILALMMSAAVHAIEEIDMLEARGGALACGTGACHDIDFGELCRDVSAVVDPDRGLNIAFPDLRVNADRHGLESILFAALRHAVAHADGTINIRLRPDARRAAACLLGVYWNDLGRSDALAGEAACRAEIESHGGEVLVTRDGEGGCGQAIEVTLTGHVLTHTNAVPSEMLERSVAPDIRIEVGRGVSGP